MGRNKQVLCYICNKQMRKDNMAQHLRTHNKKLERYVYSGERDNVKTQNGLMHMDKALQKTESGLNSQLRCSSKGVDLNNNKTLNEFNKKSDVSNKNGDDDDRIKERIEIIKEIKSLTPEKRNKFLKECSSEQFIILQKWSKMYRAIITNNDQ